MALGITFSDGKPAKMARGRYQTRNSRVVEITGYHMVTRAVSGSTFQQKIWDGNLMDATGVKPETAATWDDEGNFCDGGVGSSFGLSIVMTQEFDPEPEAEHVPPVHASDPAVLENQIVYAALVQELATVAEFPEEAPLAILKRIINERDTAEKQVAALLETPVV